MSTALWVNAIGSGERSTSSADEICENPDQHFMHSYWSQNIIQHVLRESSITFPNTFFPTLVHSYFLVYFLEYHPFVSSRCFSLVPFHSFFSLSTRSKHPR